MSIDLVYSRERDVDERPEISDGELLHRLAEDDEEALDFLIERKTRPLLQTVGRMIGDAEEAKDIVQLAFLRLWENRRKYDSRYAPNTWIYRIATNLAIDYLRSRGSKDRRKNPMQHHLRAVAEGSLESHLSRLQRGEVNSIFEELAVDLTEKQRAVFLLKELEDMSSPEIALVLECRQSTVRNHLFNARKILKEALIERFPEYAPRKVAP